MNSHEASAERALLWQQRIEAWQASEQTQKAFCQAQAINYDQFGYWLRKSRQADKQSLAHKSGFVPATLQPTVHHTTGLSLQLANGVSIHHVTEDNLSVVYQLINRLT